MLSLAAIAGSIAAIASLIVAAAPARSWWKASSAALGSSAILNVQSAVMSSALGVKTKLPTCGRITTRPCACSWPIASRTGVRLTPKELATISSEIAAPSANSPSMMAWRSRCITRCDSDFGTSSFSDRMALSDHLAGVEQMIGIERGLQRPHQRDLGLAAGMTQPLLLQRAHAVLSGDAAAHLAHETVDDRVHLFLRLLLDGKASHPGDEMQIAVADMAVIDALASLDAVGQRRLAARDELVHPRHGEADVVGDVRPQHLAELGTDVAHAPEALRLRQRLRHGGVGEQPALHQLFEPALEARRVEALVGALRFDQHVEAVACPDRRLDAGAIRDHVPIVRPHHLERRQQRAEPASCGVEQRDHGGIVLQHAERGHGRARLREQLQHHAGDDAQRAFRADEEMLQIVAGIV